MFRMTLKEMHRLWRNESATTAIEYGLIAGLVGVAIVAGATALGAGLNTLFQGIAGKLPTVN